MKMHLAFKALHEESCCAAYCKISRTDFQILVGGRDSEQQQFLFVFGVNECRNVRLTQLR